MIYTGRWSTTSTGTYKYYYYTKGVSPGKDGRARAYEYPGHRGRKMCLVFDRQTDRSQLNLDTTYEGRREWPYRTSTIVTYTYWSPRHHPYGLKN